MATEVTPEPTGAEPPARRPWALRLLVWTLALAMLVVLIPGLIGMGALWFARGQDFAAPPWIKQQIETRLAEVLPDVDIDFRALTLSVSDTWQPNLHLTDVRLRPAAGGLPIVLSDVTGSFDAAALADAQIRPRTIAVTGARILFSREAEGGYRVAFGAPDTFAPNDAAPGDVRQTLAAVNAILERPVFSKLTRIVGAGLTVQYEDRQAQRSWTVDGGRLSLTRTGNDLNLQGDFALLGGHAYATTIEMGIAAKMHSLATTLSLRVEDAAARDIATQSPGLAWLSVLDAPISGALRASTDAEGTFGPLSGTLQIGAGALAPDRTADPVPFESARTYFQYDPAAQTLVFDEVSVQSAWVQATAEGRILLEQTNRLIPAVMTGQIRITELVANPLGLYPVPLYLEGAEADLRLHFDPFRLELGRLDLRDRGQTLSFAGWVNAEPEGWDLSVTGRLDEMTADDLLEVWPSAALTKTRDWVARNVLDGVLHNVQLGIRSTPSTRPDIMLGFDFDDLITTFARNMPPIEAASGRGELRGDRFVVTADAGHIYSPQGRGLDIAGTSFVYKNVRVKRGPAEVLIRAAGEIGDVLSLIDTEPLSLLSKAGRGPDLARGMAEVAATLAFNVVKPLPVDQIAISYDARLSDVTSDVIVPGQTLSAKALRVTGTARDIAITGEAMLGKIPVGGTWSSQFGPGAPGGSRVDGWVEVSEAAAQQLNLGLTPGMIGGRGRAKIALDLPKGGTPAFELSSDLAGISLALDALGWRKPAGQPGSFTVAGTLGQPPAIDRIALSAAGLTTQGTITLKPGGGGLDRARFDRVQLGGWLDAPVTLTGRGKGVPPAVAVTGGTVDLRRMKLGASGQQGGPLSLALDRLQVSDGIALQSMRGDFTAGGGLSGSFTGRVNGTAPIAGTVVPKSGRSAVRITSDNAGAALAAAGLLGKGQGGTLDLTLNPAAAEGSYDGFLKVANISLQNAPAMASLLSALSVVGLLEQMSGNGILFNDVEADFRLNPGSVVVRRSSAVGASMGISMDGYYNTRDKTMDMQGVVSPVYMINGIGQLFSRKGEGLLGFNYQLTGPAASPRVQVNPLSLFTPGMFREIFRRPPPQTN